MPAGPLEDSQVITWAPKGARAGELVSWPSNGKLITEHIVSWPGRPISAALARCNYGNQEAGLAPDFRPPGGNRTRAWPSRKRQAIIKRHQAR